MGTRKHRKKRAVISRICERAKKSSVYRQWLNASTNCFYCEVELSQNSTSSKGELLSDTKLTADHFIPYQNTRKAIALENLVPCCYLCNQLKKSNDPIEYWMFAQFNIKPIRHDEQKLLEFSYKDERYSIIRSVNNEIKRNIFRCSQ